MIALLFFVSAVTVTADEREACRSYWYVDDFTFGTVPGFTLLTEVPKVPKKYSSFGPPSKRRGRGKIVTTLYSVHSKEALAIIDKVPPAQDMLNELFRCRGFGKKKTIDPLLLETIIAAAIEFEAERVEIISAYRSPKFNDTLAKKGRRVAVESKHTMGRAIDFRLVGTKTSELSKWIWDNFDGGLGTYRNDNFVHIDTGAKRRWRGK